MTKALMGSVITTLFLSSVLQAHPIAPDEVKQFAAQALQIDFDKAPKDVQDKISSEYTKRIKLGETLVVKLKNDPEFVRISETVALDLWSKRIAGAVSPSDEELKKVYGEMKDLNIAPSYKIRHIVVANEVSANDIINQLNTKMGDERNQLFSTIASTQSIDPSSKQKGGSVGWVDASALPPAISAQLQDKVVGAPFKLSIGKDVWEIIMLDEIKAAHAATFDEAKNYLLNTMRQKAVEEEANKLLVNDTAKSSTKKTGKK
jgi:parvulin-like peptidyl-prolyl isomerase